MKSWLASVDSLGEGNSEGEKRGECKGVNVLWDD